MPSDNSDKAQTAAVALDWLDRSTPLLPCGVSWGVPWPRGAVRQDQTFTLNTPDGKALPLQSWPLAYWPDGSLKWGGFATVTASTTTGPLELTPGEAEPIGGASAVQVEESGEAIQIDTGYLQCSIPHQGNILVESLAIDGRQVATQGHLVCILQEGPDGDVDQTPSREKFVSRIQSVTVEQSGPVRAVVKFAGVHQAEKGDREWLPFTVRLYFYAGQAPVRLVHSILFDGDQEKDFIRGLGLVFSVPMREQVHNRHIRFSGEGAGLWAEPIQPLTGRRVLLLPGQEPAERGRRDEESAYRNQLAGKRIPDREAFAEAGQKLLADWAVWSDFKLVQPTADGFAVHKRTNPQSCWLEAGAGQRASGLAFVGDVSGGLGIGVKNFWQSFPSSLEILDAASETAELRVWLWSPDASAMDLRHYDTRDHDLDSSYEDVQPGFSTPHGIGRTSELTLFPSAGIPARGEVIEQARFSNQTPLLVCAPEYLHAVRALGIWSLPDHSTAGKRWIEDQLDRAFAFYQKEVEQRHWYGFWNYGDVMHAYDPARHVWRYDIGGFAWDNTELMPDMWLWYSFLRTGRADVFRMAEAMSRHTGEVDVYHLGRFAGLGSRHNVRHWGCGAKELRISQGPLRRYYHYLTTDERSGDLMRDVVDVDRTLLDLDPMRIAMPESEYPSDHPSCARARIGPDWLALVGNWMTEWERTGDARWRDKILAGVECLAQAPYGFFSAREAMFGYDPDTGKLNVLWDDAIGAYHLSVLMGGPEVAFELTDFLDSPEWSAVWMQFCRLYGAPGEEVVEAFGRDAKLGGMGAHYARLPAYVAMIDKDPAFAQRAWEAFLDDGGRRRHSSEIFASQNVEGPEVLNPIDEVPRISTNDTAQWCLNAIELLEMVGDQMPEKNPLWDEETGTSGTEE